MARRHAKPSIRYNARKGLWLADFPGVGRAWHQSHSQALSWVARCYGRIHPRERQ